MAVPSNPVNWGLPVGRNGDVGADRSPSVRAARAWLTLAALAIAALAAVPVVAAQAKAGPLVLGRWPNPLPHPLDGPYGAFLLDVLAWLAVASFTRIIVGPVLHTLARSTKTTLDDKVIDIVGTPIFVILLAIGVRASLEVFALSAVMRHALDLGGTLLGIAVLGYVFYRAWNEVALVYARRLADRTHSTVDNRLLPVLERLGGVIIILFAAIAFLQALGLSFGWLLAGGAFASLVIGLAAQDTLSNFFSGMHLLLDQPFREGDEIQMEGGQVCTVRKVGLRSSHLYNAVAHEMLIVPNNLLATKPVTNLMRPDRRHRLWLKVNAAYRSDPDQVRRLLTEAALAHPLVLREPGNEPQVRLTGFGDSALEFVLVVWLADHQQRNAASSDLRIGILRRFSEAGIDIPFPHRVVVQPTPPAPPVPVAPDAATAAPPAES
jgi:small-conductance mechanosensitive channel